MDDLNFDLLKKHPYATGGIVIVGGLVVFYFLSSGSSSSAVPVASSGSSDYQASLSADEQMAQVQAGASVQAQAQQVALQQAQLQQEITDRQTDASLEIGNTQTAAQLALGLAQIQAQRGATDDQYQFEENTTQMQDNVLEEQINSGVLENANNNATALGAVQIQAGVAGKEIDAATGLATNAQNIYAENLPYILTHAGAPQNSALDATDQTAIFETVLSGGNPNVASAGTAGSTTVAVSGNQTQASIVGSLTSGLAALSKGLFG